MNNIKYDYKNFSLEELSEDSIDRYTLNFVPPHTKVLELGCATGFHSQYLQEKQKCTVIGVDVDVNAARLAKTIMNTVIIGNLDSTNTWNKINAAGPFEVCFASNVLEHLVDPWIALKRIHAVLEPNGVLIVAVPNIAFWRARLRLLKGIWEYEEYGIFDKTHTRFFTLDSIRHAINEASFKIVEEKYDPAGGAKWLTPILKQFPNAYAYQIGIKAIKK